jgi:uncharacterized Tic20 family protein
MINSPSPDEKMMAALAHGSVLLSFFGPIVPALLWNSQRRKSSYVNFHALQALGYQAMFFWFWLIAVFGIAFLSIVLIIPMSIFFDNASSNITAAPFLIQPIIFVGIFSIFGLYFLIGFIGAILCFTGREFHYPLLGKWLERYLSHGSDSEVEFNEAQEDNWVAGMCHAMAILQLWGIVLPLIVWVTQKERSIRLKFQAMQAMAYQGAAFIAYLIGMMVYMLFFFGMLFVIIAGGALSTRNEISAPFGIVFLVIFLVMMIFGVLVTLIVPLYQLFALIASISVIRGNNYHYPVLGKFLEQRMGLLE